MLRVNMLDADRILESAEDMTAAETAPRPTKDTATGVRFCRTIGRIMDASPFSTGVGFP